MDRLSTTTTAKIGVKIAMLCAGLRPNWIMKENPPFIRSVGCWMELILRPTHPFSLSTPPRHPSPGFLAAETDRETAVEALR